MDIQCPFCAKEYDKRFLLHRNVKSVGNTDIAYDLCCPYCKEAVGEVFWGKMKLYGDGPAGGAQTDAHTAGPANNRPEEPCYVCPHCGGDLPHDLSELPKKRDKSDRRTEDRRSGEDRRKNVSLLHFPEHRKVNRRKNPDRRDGLDRREENYLAGQPDQRKGDRRQRNVPVKFDRRRTGTDRRKDDPGSENVALEV